MTRPAAFARGIAVAALAVVSASPASASPAPGTSPGTPPAPAPVGPAQSASILGLIDTAIVEGRLDDARDLIERARASVPARQLALRQAEYTLARGGLEEAAAAFSALTSDPGVGPLAYQGFGIAKLRAGDNQAAIRALDLAVAANPKLARAWTARGVAADRERDWATADADYARAVLVDPRSADALTNRGYSRMLRGRFAEAEADLGAALAIDPKLDVARTDLRIARAMQGDYKGAFVGSNKASLARDLNTVGFGAMARGDYPTAESYFNRAMRIDPSFNRTAWANLQYLKQLAQHPAETALDQH